MKLLKIYLNYSKVGFASQSLPVPAESDTSVGAEAIWILWLLANVRELDINWFLLNISIQKSQTKVSGDDGIYDSTNIHIRCDGECILYVYCITNAVTMTMAMTMTTQMQCVRGSTWWWWWRWCNLIPCSDTRMQCMRASNGSIAICYRPTLASHISDEEADFAPTWIIQVINPTTRIASVRQHQQ